MRRLYYDGEDPCLTDLRGLCPRGRSLASLEGELLNLTPETYEDWKSIVDSENMVSTEGLLDTYNALYIDEMTTSDMSVDCARARARYRLILEIGYEGFEKFCFYLNNDWRIDTKIFECTRHHIIDYLSQPREWQLSREDKR